MAQNTESFRISPKLQEILCLLGQAYVFEDAEEILNQTLGIEISAKQIQKVSEHYGGKIEEQQQHYIEKEDAPQVNLKAEEDPVYCMPDGSMIFTREEGWKEIKVGRIFTMRDRVAIHPCRKSIIHSLYLCHLGTHRDFLEKWEVYLHKYKKKIFIADGASWIWNWVKDTYPDAIQILDFWHAVEKLAHYAICQYTDKDKREQWLEEKKQQLRKSQVEKIIQELRFTVPRTQEAQKAKIDVIRYYENNSERMQYASYLEKGYLIGSGAIEAAHRNVVQQRLKLSGQRWSLKGAQQIVNLRTLKKSNLWNIVVNLIKKAA